MRSPPTWGTYFVQDKCREGHIQQSEFKSLFRIYSPKILKLLLMYHEMMILDPWFHFNKKCDQHYEHLNQLKGYYSFYKKIRALKHEINFLASFIASIMMVNSLLMKWLSCNHIMIYFSEENLANVSYQNLKESYESSFVYSKSIVMSLRGFVILHVSSDRILFSLRNKNEKQYSSCRTIFDIYSQVFISLFGSKMYVYEDGELVPQHPLQVAVTNMKPCGVFPSVQ